MHTNDTNKKLIYPKLSYLLTGICFEVHNTLGRYSREKQYAGAIEERLINLSIPYEKEWEIPNTGNKVDFLIDKKIILEIKAKRFITRDDYYQAQRYLQASDIRLGLLVNFRNRYLKPARIVRIETSAKNKFV